MNTINITLSEFKSLMNHIQLPPETKLNITFDDDEHALKILKRKKSLEAMRKLRGSGNGKLVNTLLIERQKDKAI
jgi:hypothetical protein